MWLFRNDIVFNNKILDEIQVFDLVKTCMAWWCKAKWPSTLFLFSDFYIAASNLSFNVQPKSPKTITFWCPSPSGFMKFNVNGSVKGKPGPSRIGGVLRDELGVVKGIFSKAVGVMDSNQAELLAILEALLVSVESNFFTSLSLIIESDFSNAVS